MRFMIIVKANADSEAGVMPTSQEIADMGKFNEEMIDAGIMLAGEGLHPTSKGARIKFEGGKSIVTEGPFSGTKDLIAGFWLITVPTREQALDWCRRIPFRNGEEVELRQVFEASEFEVDDLTREHIEKEQAFRDANEKPITR